MSAQRSRSAVAPGQGSAFPGFAGVPGWSAVLIAVTLTLAGFAIEAGLGHQELGALFAVCFAVGCVAAVLAVKPPGLFAAVIQPPLLLFVAIPLAYWLLQGGKFNGLKDALITCGYPLIERFPLMLTTSAAVLTIGLVRWYVGKSHTAAASADDGHGDRHATPTGFASRIVSTLTGGGTAADRAGGRRHSGRPSRAKRPAARDSAHDGAARREPQASSRARHARPSRQEQFADAPPRRRRGQSERSSRDFEPSPRPRRRPRAADGTESRQVPPPLHRDPRQRPPEYGQRPPEYGPRDGRRESTRQTSREDRRDSRTVRDFDQPYPPRPDYTPRPDYSGPGYDAGPGYAGPYPPRRHPEGDPRSGEAPRSAGSKQRGDRGHHPVSRVRYRSDDSGKR